MELYVTLVSMMIYLLVALAFWVDDGIEPGADSRMLHALACIVWPVLVIFALAAVAVDAAISLFRVRR